ncbi:hypothetical protein V2W30_01430 [Streptomyces sp. Q6]|uniref:Uncharacterized protein n=1 Tax=Streptomyces citrinus TaxID=3118173 RepID=A0ACD5A4X7_9ACTN
MPGGLVGGLVGTPDSEIVSVTVDLALFAVLFTDGMQVAFPGLRAHWKNPACPWACRWPSSAGRW